MHGLVAAALVTDIAEVHVHGERRHRDRGIRTCGLPSQDGGLQVSPVHRCRPAGYGQDAPVSRAGDGPAVLVLERPRVAVRRGGHDGGVLLGALVAHPAVPVGVRLVLRLDAADKVKPRLRGLVLREEETRAIDLGAAVFRGQGLA